MFRKVKDKRVTLIAEEKGNELGETSLACPHCGHTGKDVITALEYVGGQGYVPGTHCVDEIACWARWDVQHGFENTPAIREMQAREVLENRVKKG